MHFRGTKSILHAYVFHVFTLFATFSQICFVDSEIFRNSEKLQIHKIYSSRSSRFTFSRFLGVFVCDLFSLPGHEHLFGAALQRDGGTQTTNPPNDPNDPKPPFPKNFQYLPVISSQKWSCKCCKQPKSSPPFPIPFLPFDLNATYAMYATYATWSWNQIMTGQENTRDQT